VNDRSDRRFYRQRKTIYQRMRRMNEFDPETPDLRDVIRLYAVQQHVVQQVVLFQLALRQAKRKT
jgi:hypothetical protein